MFGWAKFGLKVRSIGRGVGWSCQNWKHHGRCSSFIFMSVCSLWFAYMAIVGTRILGSIMIWRIGTTCTRMSSNYEMTIGEVKNWFGCRTTKVHQGWEIRSWRGMDRLTMSKLNHPMFHAKYGLIFLRRRFCPKHALMDGPQKHRMVYRNIGFSAQNS